jgi:anti-sigma regulatory factor (Ser/Thr protein kinase)
VTDHLNGSSDRRGAWRQWELPATGQAAGRARQVTREVLAGWQRADLEETAVLIVSELVTNAVRHASTAGSLVALRLEIAGMSVRIEVHDTDPRWPQPSIPAGLDESGFGFVLVNALASKWGVSDTATGKAVWAELDPGGV